MLENMRWPNQTRWTNVVGGEVELGLMGRQGGLISLADYVGRYCGETMWADNVGRQCGMMFVTLITTSANNPPCMKAFIE